MHNYVSRREFLAGAAATAVAAGARHARAETDTATLLSEFDYGDVILTGGPLKAQYDRLHAAYLALDNDRLLRPYRLRAGMPAPGAPMGGWYGGDGFVPGHSLGQYISGLARMGRTTGDPACRSKIGELVDGFTATMGSGDRIYAGPNAEKVWPCYVLDKHLAGLIDAATLSGIAPARELIPRVYRGALPYIPAQGHDRIGKKDPPYDETYILPENLFLAYSLTNDRALYDRALAYLLDREYFDPLARGEDVLPGRHAYSHVMALSSAGKARLVLGRERYLAAMRNAWELLATTQQYASGGWGPNETFIEPHKGQLYASLQSTDDHFETPCGSYAGIKLARYLLCATGDGRYGDGLERLVYNGLLAAKDPDSDGDYFYYSTYGARARKVYYPKRWPCCSGTLVQGVADYVKNIYFRTEEGVAVNLYTPSQLQWEQDGVAVRIAQETGYPLEPVVTLHVACAEPIAFPLQLRIPGWSQNAPTVKVNGRKADAAVRLGFAVLRRRWRDGDTVTVEFKPEFRTEAIDDLHPETVAVLRGPLVYVELNPAEGPAHLAAIDALRPTPGDEGIYCVETTRGARIHAPLYFVREESYSTYFEARES